MDSGSRKTYYLQAVPDGEEPDWPCPVEELVVGHQPLDGNLIQYWAYFKESGKDPSDLPRAEVVASEYKTNNPAILIDEYSGGEGESLELILVKGGHALAKTQSSIDNLEDNISAVLETAKRQFGLEVEHFMTTDRVSQEVESKLNDLEETEEPNQKTQKDSDNQNIRESDKPELADTPTRLPAPERSDGGQGPSESFQNDFEMNEPENEGVGIRKVNSQVPTGGIFTAQKKDSGNVSSSKLWIILPVILLLFAVAGVFSYINKDQLLAKMSFGGKAEVAATPTPTPEPTPTPTPTPTVERKEFSVRILNGTKTTGAAAKLRDKLKSLGWEVLTVGNNKDQTVEQTLINAKEESEEAMEVLISDLSSDYQASEGAALKSTDKADLEVIIGAK